MALARRLRADEGAIELGDTADAIEAQIRKLVKERNEPDLTPAGHPRADSQRQISEMMVTSYTDFD
jgi:hypothetical protein